MLTRAGILFLLISILASGGAGATVYYDWQHRDIRRPPPTQVEVKRPRSSPSVSVSPTASPSATPLPASLRLQTVPFTVQAPFQVWDAAHEEYCEAAAVYMVGQWFARDTRPDIPPAEADAAMGRYVAWERGSFPGTLNLSLAQMGQVGAHFYGLHSQVVPADLHVAEQNLAAGSPVILPVMTHGGPGGTKIYGTYGYQNVYHVLVITGYDNARQIVYTNDAGLREGRDLAYQWTVLAAANQSQATTARDGSGAAVPMQQGPSMLVFSR
jgi:Peptidase_C39 like family